MSNVFYGFFNKFRFDRAAKLVYFLSATLVKSKMEVDRNWKWKPSPSVRPQLLLTAFPPSPTDCANGFPFLLFPLNTGRSSLHLAFYASIAFCLRRKRRLCRVILPREILTSVTDDCNKRQRSHLHAKREPSLCLVTLTSDLGAD